ncbi:hypothetical protein BJ741DRAFT_120931 [Chytriomyces cf. hyalinus JEL632]|nr:hypothetical protein BJ741DRAFT_120931 [Chytriomyces cf. hyalinus JEL632]
MKLPGDEISKSHQNAFPNKVVEGSERVYNLSVFNMQGHKHTPLKLSPYTFKGALTSNVDLGDKTPTSAVLGQVTEYGGLTLQTPALVDELNAVFFPDSVQRKKDINHLIYKHERQVSTRVVENGGYPLRYIARNMLNPKHRDSKDDKVIPSTLLYGGKFAGEKSFLKLSKHDVSIPISEGSIISFFAGRIHHEVDVDPEFLESKNRFQERIVEVFGSYDSIYKNLTKRDEKMKAVCNNLTKRDMKKAKKGNEAAAVGKK